MKKQMILIPLILLLSMPMMATSGGITYVDVKGLVCDFCVRSLEKTIGGHPSVESIHINLNDRLITIHRHTDLHLDDDTIIHLIKDSGYTVHAIRHEQ